VQCTPANRLGDAAGSYYLTRRIASRRAAASRRCRRSPLALSLAVFARPLLPSPRVLPRLASICAGRPCAQSWMLDMSAKDRECHSLVCENARLKARLRMSAKERSKVLRDNIRLKAELSIFETVVSEQDAELEARVNARFEEERWRAEVLRDNDFIEAELRQIEEMVPEQSVSNVIVKFFAGKGRRCQAFVTARRMTSKGDKSFKKPCYVGKLRSVNATLMKFERAGDEEPKLSKRENSWVFQAVMAYLHRRPVILKSCLSSAAVGRRTEGKEP